jgi:4-hydroxy-tetrahydrodipicolinate synthase
MDLLAGNDDKLAEVLDKGGTGGICVASHVVGREMRRMIDEPDQRQDIHNSLMDIFDVMFITASPTPVKAALNMLGITAGTLRLPMVEASEEEEQEIRGVLERHGLLSAV